MLGKLEELETELNLLPEKIQAFLETPLPAPPAASLPSTIENAVITNGIASYYFLELFRPFAGLTPVEIFMRIGQKNEVLQCILKAIIEYKGTEGLLEILAPVKDGIYYGYFSDWKVSCNTEETPTSIKITCNGQTETMEAGEGGNYTYQFPIPIGSHTGKVSAEYEDGSTIEATVNFQVKSYSEIPTVPERNGTYPQLTQTRIDTGLSTPSITNVTCQIDTLPASPMLKELLGSKFTYDIPESWVDFLMPGGHVMRCTVTDETGQHTIETPFTIAVYT